MASRKDRMKNIRKQLRGQKFSRATIFISISAFVISIGLIGFIYTQYQATQKWSNARINGTQSKIPPEFAKNNYSISMLNDINSLSSMTSMLNTINHDGGVQAKTITKAQKIAENSEAILKAYKITGGSSYTDLTNLKLDIAEYKIESTAYTEPDSNELGRVINEIKKRNLSNETQLDTTLLSRLSTIANDYQDLNDFVNKYVPEMGTINNGVVTVNKSVDKNLTTDILDNIDNHKLTKFTNIQSLKQLLTTSKWHRVLQNNQNISEHEKWNTTVAVFHALSQSQYISMNKIATLADARKLNATIEGDVAKDGFKILDTSNVTKITVNGTVVKDNQYIRKDANITVTITPTYEKIKESSSSSSSSSIESNDSSSSSNSHVSSSSSDSSSSIIPSSSSSTSSSSSSSNSNDSSSVSSSSSQTTESSAVNTMP